MISQTGFTILLFAIWISAFGFGALVIYWFVRQGFAEQGIERGTEFPLEQWEETRTSLLIWGGFFLLLFIVIIIGG